MPMLQKFRKSRSKNLRQQRSGRDPDQYDLVDAYDAAAARRLKRDPSTGLLSKPKSKSPRLAPRGEFEDLESYRSARDQLTRFEDALGFEHDCRTRASEIEREANEILQKVKKRDIGVVYEAAPARRGFGGQRHPRFYGDRFLSNAELIERTDLFRICRRMPKGAHLHIHFNANLLPHVLIDIAKDMERMFITSDIPLVPEDSDAFDRCKIQFSILSPKAVVEHGGLGNIFERSYADRKPMSFREFRDQFSDKFITAYGLNGESDPLRGRRPSLPGRAEVDVDIWLRNKLVFDEEEAHNSLQTADGAWEKFNGRTQMMKGLFNYETAYKKYTLLCLQEFVEDNIQYAEIRPNFMSTNQVWKDDGSDRIDNRGIIKLITTAYTDFQQDHKHRVLKDLKIIYCTPRSFDPGKVKTSLDECLTFKLDYPKWIAGFDLVGEESKGRPLKDFIEQFLRFKKDCKEKGVEIPFLFHCGETLDFGKDTDGNLVDALLLGSKRIGHGFALPRHPYVMEQMKKRNICVELCPISNEILGLTPRVNGHAMYSLLANNVHCTVSTDNGTLFRSRLSHDFYQVMAGKADMTLHGWRQLIEWSLEHSCLDDGQRASVRNQWEVMWEDFCKWIKAEFGSILEENNVVKL